MPTKSKDSYSSYGNTERVLYRTSTPPKWQYKGVGDTVLYGLRMMINMRPKSCHYLIVAQKYKLVTPAPVERDAS